jgi:hypothetical protein
MTANELRQGNLIRWKSTNDIEAVVDIKSSGKYQTINNIRITDAEPIPLTEEWLLKMGFEKDYQDDYMMVWRGVTFYFRISDKSLRRDFGIKTKISIINIEYVNQLQNLFYLLTGKELTINEKITNFKP